jgi:hypothetical protein
MDSKVMRKILKYIEMPIPYWLSPVGIILLSIIWSISSWVTETAIVTIIPESTHTDWKYHIGIKGVPIYISSISAFIGALIVAVFVTKRNKQLDDEKHQRDLAIKQIDATNAWLLDAKMAFDNLKIPLNRIKRLRQNWFQDDFQVAGSNIAQIEPMISENLLSLTFLDWTPTSRELDFNNIHSIQRLVGEINLEIPKHIQRLNSFLDDYKEIQDKNSQEEEKSSKDPTYKKTQYAIAHNFYRGEAEYIANEVIRISDSLATFIKDFPNIASERISKTHQQNYMKILRFHNIHNQPIGMIKRIEIGKKILSQK